MTGDGQCFVALSDRARLFRGCVTRQDGRITDVRGLTGIPLRSTKGDRPRRFHRDSEGIALRDDGRMFVSFEGFHRVWVYLADDAPAAWLPRHDAFADLPLNGGLEALAIAPDGALITLPENAETGAGRIPVYRYADGRWIQPYALPAHDGFKPTGADFGPDGLFYLLERRFTGLAFQSRLRRFRLTPDGPADETLLLTTRPGQHDNLEGLSVWRAADGTLRATMVADDNFRFFQRTQIVEYALP